MTLTIGTDLECQDDPAPRAKYVCIKVISLESYHPDRQTHNRT